MSKIKALITTLVLGTSSLASADSGLSFSASANWSIGTQPAPVAVRTPAIRDHRTVVNPMPTPYRPAWVALSQPLMLDGRSAIRLETPSRFSQLRLQATAGALYIDSLTIRFSDGTRQEIAVNKNLDTRTPMLSLNIANRASIHRVIINGTSSRRATFQLFGSSFNGPVIIEQPPVYQPPVYQPPVYQPPAGMLLASDMNFANTEGRRIVYVAADKGRISTLRVAGLEGLTHIQSVQVFFTDGSTQLMSVVDKDLRRGQSIDLVLDGRGAKTVTRIDLWTTQTPQHVSTATGQFSVSGL